MTLASDLKTRCENAVEFAAGQLRAFLHEPPEALPLFTAAGKWRHAGEAWTHWCDGFWGGQFWILHGLTGDARWRDQAVLYSRRIEHRKTDRSVHDLGFLFWPTWKRWYDLEGDETVHRAVIEAGRTLALRFRDRGKYLCSFLAENSLFIDVMMNVGIIFHAARQDGDQDLWNKALNHSLTTRRTLVRGDGSTAQEGIFDTETGAFLRWSTQQGWRADSCWARGLAWAIYGFCTVYRHTNDLRFLGTAEATARFYMERTAAGGVPPNDWDEPSPKYPFESSAAAIAACGFLELSELEADPGMSEQHRRYALQILDSLTGPEFLAFESPGWEGILKHGIYHIGKGLGVDESVAWGDYFFLEALERVLNHDRIR
jgi:unsaturated chondroitin disaccharide hydrolase